MNLEQNKMVAPKYVAELLGVSVQTVRNLCDRKELRSYLLPSGHRRVRLVDLEDFINKHECEKEGRGLFDTEDLY